MNALQCIADELGTQIWDLQLVRLVFDYTRPTVYSFKVYHLKEYSCNMTYDRKFLCTGGYPKMFYAIPTRFTLEEVRGWKEFPRGTYRCRTNIVALERPNASLSPNGKYIIRSLDIPELHRVRGGETYLIRTFSSKMNVVVVRCSNNWVYFLHGSKWYACNHMGDFEKPLPFFDKSFHHLWVSNSFVVGKETKGIITIRKDCDHKVVGQFVAEREGVCWNDLTFSLDEKYLAVLWYEWYDHDGKSEIVLCLRGPNAMHISLYCLETWKKIGDYDFGNMFLERIFFVENRMLLASTPDEQVHYLCPWNWKLLKGSHVQRTL